jgi:malate dehydrogenase (oxaloacetate-decarboxylating)(NADP+)
VYAEGEDERVLRAVQAAIDEGLARPILVGRPAVIETRAKRAGLRIRAGADFELVDPEDDARFRDYWTDYRQLMGRRGVTPELAKATMRRSATTIAAMMVRRNDAEAMVCGMVGRFDDHLARVRDTIGLAPGASCFAAMNALMLPEHTLFVTDTLVNDEPSAEQLAEIARLAVEGMRAFGMPPKVAFVSHSMFGSSERPSARRVRAGAALFAAAHPQVECDGEMHGDAALSEDIRREFLPESALTGSANLLVMPNLDAANILFNVLKVTGGKGITVGPILLGAAKPVHILTPAATMRRVLNVTALAVAQAATLGAGAEAG